MVSWTYCQSFLKTQAGEAWVTLKVALGPHPFNVQHQNSSHNYFPASPTREAARTAGKAGHNEEPICESTKPSEHQESVTEEVAATNEDKKNYM